ncbi:TniB family NTP-binding protein [Ensifer sp. SL37]|uniref:TniB family NTP-binding protein n=1 Tax=Ensifer sp. SL37 TaxID=2995137 RepID=UPI002273B363|nr:TniB family NTP-binding protein [Ensifer sp. SL37]
MVDRLRSGTGRAATVRIPSAVRAGEASPAKRLAAQPHQQRQKHGGREIPSRSYAGSAGRDRCRESAVVVVQMPTNPTISRFYAALLAELGAPGPRAGGGVRSHDLEQMALNILRAVNARVLVIDELHNMLAGSASARREFLNLLRYLGNALRIPLIGVGTQEAYLAIRTDPQLENRFEPIILPLWEPGSETAKLLMSFAASLPLRRSSPDLLRPDVIKLLLIRTGGTIGEMLALLRAAAIAAIETGDESISERTLRIADYKGPVERRISIERQLVPG